VRSHEGSSGTASLLLGRFHFRIKAHHKKVILIKLTKAGLKFLRTTGRSTQRST
jgi:hypothetical protein